MHRHAPAAPAVPPRRRIPQFFVEMHDDGSFRRLLRAGLEDGHAVIVERFCPETRAWIADGGLLRKWWFDRSQWRAISMGRALGVLEVLERGDVALPPFDAVSSGKFPVVAPSRPDDEDDTDARTMTSTSSAA